MHDFKCARSVSMPSPLKAEIVMRGGPEVQFGQFRDFIEHNPSWPGLNAMRRHAELALKDQSDATAAEAFEGTLTDLYIPKR